jgi:hypothetical protein
MRNKPIVGANYATRIPPILPTATGLDGAPLFEGEDVSEVLHAGFGCLLVSMEVFAAIDKPYFALGYSPKDDDYSGEDVFFFQKARKAGFSVWIDHSLSEEVGHLGEFEYTMAHTRMTREAANGAG